MPRRTRPEPSSAAIDVLNLEAGLPTVEEALGNLDVGISLAKAAGYPALKVIHGYGSSGVGGRLKRGIHAALARLTAEGRIREWVSGEDWDLFDVRALAILGSAPGAETDPDLGRGNGGVSLVLL